MDFSFYFHLGLPLGENEENPQDSYKNLKLLVQRIIEEVFKLPELFDYSGVKDDQKNILPEFDPKKYEELLATAVLNKVCNNGWQKVCIIVSHSYRGEVLNLSTAASVPIEEVQCTTKL